MTLSTHSFAYLRTNLYLQFLWARFMVMEILKKRTESAILRALQNAPRGLDDSIRYVLKGLSQSLCGEEEFSQHFNMLLTWATYVPVSMTLAQMNAIITFTDGNQNLHLERTLRFQFSSLFVLGREDDLTTADLQRMEETNGEDVIPANLLANSHPASTTVKLCHTSIGPFFRKGIDTVVSAGTNWPVAGIEPQAAQVTVKTCLLQLCKSSPLEGIEAEIAALVRSTRLSNLGQSNPAHLQTEDKNEIGTLLVEALQHPVGSRIADILY